MKNPAKTLVIINTIHSLIWLIMASAVFYILYSGLSGHLTPLTFVSIGLLIIETIVLLANRWACPLTLVAQSTNPQWQDGDDIFLPKWLAVNNKLIFGSLLVFGLFMVVYRLVTQ